MKLERNSAIQLLKRPFCTLWDRRPIMEPDIVGKMTRDSVAMQINVLPSEIKPNWVASAQNKVNAAIDGKAMYSKSRNIGPPEKKKEKGKEEKGSNAAEIAKAETSENQITSRFDFHRWHKKAPYLSFSTGGRSALTCGGRPFIREGCELSFPPIVLHSNRRCRCVI